MWLLVVALVGCGGGRAEPPLAARLQQTLDRERVAQQIPGAAAAVVAALLFANLAIRLLGSDDFPVTAKHKAAADMTAGAQDGALHLPIDDPLPLARIAEAHDHVDAGARKRVVLSIPD